MQVAKRVRQIADPMVRELLKLIAQEGVISFAGGVPAREVLASEKIREVGCGLSNWDIQYGQAGGRWDLREAIGEWLTEKWGMVVEPEMVLVTVGSQQALDLLARAVVDEGGVVGVERPSYFVALSALATYGARFKEVRVEKGFEVDKQSQLIYLVTNFQNPTGRSLNKSERQVVVEWSQQIEGWVVEDDPYGELYFGKQPSRPVFVDSQGESVYVGSFSKILGPGLRVGYVVAKKEFIEVLERVRTGMDICPPGISQQVVAKVLKEKDWWQSHLKQVRRFYKQRGEWMREMLARYMEEEEVEWVKPQGGMFYWVRVKGVDTRVMLKEAVERGVAYVPGEVFDFKKERSEWMRLSFATVGKEEMEEGMKRLAKVIKKYQKKGGKNES